MTEKKQHQQQSMGDIYVFPKHFNEIVKTIHPQKLLNPTFISLRLGISEHFILRAMLPQLDINSVNVVIPFMRSIEEIFSPNCIPEQRSLASLDEPPVPCEYLGVFYEEMKKTLPSELHSMVQSLDHLRQQRLIYYRPNDFLRANGNESLDSIESEKAAEAITKTIIQLAQKYDPICRPGQFLTTFDANDQTAGLEIIKRIIKQAILQGRSFRYKPMIVLVEVFGPFDLQFIGGLRDLMYKGQALGIILWLHAEIAHTPQYLLDQFRNHIVLMPSKAESSKLVNIQANGLCSDGVCLNVALFNGPCVDSERSWKMIPLGDMGELSNIPVYNWGDLTNLLLGVDNIDILCRSLNFHEVVDKFSREMGKDIKVQRVLEYCFPRTNQLKRLVEHIEKYDNDLYERYLGGKKQAEA